MKAFLIQNENKTILAAFRDHEKAVEFCHQNSLPIEWIIEGEIKIRIGMGR